MNSNSPINRHVWKPGPRHNESQLRVHQRHTLDGVSGEPVIVHPIVANKNSQDALNERRRQLSVPIGKTARRLSLLEQATQQAENKQPNRRGWHGALAVCAVAIVVLTGYVSIDTWVTNRKVEAQAAEQSNQTMQPTQNDSMPANGNITSTAVHSSKRYSLADYKVAAELPRAIYIKKISISGRILPLGLNKDGAIDAPKNAYDAGWYDASAKPGMPGAMVLDGHSSGAGDFGLFGKIHKLQNGDIITIEKGEGTKLDYKVVAKETLHKDAVDMKKVMRPYGSAAEGANFITCAGEWTDDNTTMTERTIVYTERI